MQPIKVRRLVRSLKGSPAQILLAFLFVRRAMDVQEIHEWTGLKRETIYQALPALEGLVVRQSVMAHGREIFAPGGDLLPFFQTMIDFTEEPETVSREIQMSEKRTSGIDSVVVDDLSLNRASITTTTTTIGQESEKRTPGEMVALNAVLDEYVIIGAKRKQLIACEWVDAAYVRVCVEQAKNEPANWDNPVGMAITRMLEHVPMPSTRENGHAENCRCEKCKVDDFFGQKARRKYAEGPYAAYINRDDDESEDADES